MVLGKQPSENKPEKAANNDKLVRLVIDELNRFPKFITELSNAVLRGLEAAVAATLPRRHSLFCQKSLWRYCRTRANSPSAPLSHYVPLALCDLSFLWAFNIRAIIMLHSSANFLNWLLRHIFQHTWARGEGVTGGPSSAKIFRDLC